MRPWRRPAWPFGAQWETGSKHSRSLRGREEKRSGARLCSAPRNPSHQHLEQTASFEILKRGKGGGRKVWFDGKVLQFPLAEEEANYSANISYY